MITNSKKQTSPQRFIGYPNNDSLESLKTHGQFNLTTTVSNSSSRTSNDISNITNMYVSSSSPRRNRTKHISTINQLLVESPERKWKYLNDQVDISAHASRLANRRYGSPNAQYMSPRMTSTKRNDLNSSISLYRSDYDKRDIEDSRIQDMATRVSWRTGIKAKGSSWKSKAIVLIGRDMLVLGGIGDNNPHTQLYICDTDTMQWSGARLNGEGPGDSSFYYSIASDMGDKLFVLWTNQKCGCTATVVTSYESKDSSRLTVKKGQSLIVQLNNVSDTDSDWLSAITMDGFEGKVPSSCIKIHDNTNINQSSLELSVLSFTENMLWSRVDCFGEVPTAREYYTCTRIRNQIYLFGGRDSTGNLQNDIFILNTDTFRWKQCDCISEKPRPRYAHSATIVDDQILVYGGLDSSGDYLSDMYVFSVTTSTWRKIETQGLAPGARAFHSFTRFEDMLILYGGRDATTVFGDTNVFHYPSKTWATVEVDGEMPSERYLHFCDSLDHSLIYFGGQNRESQLFDIYFLTVDSVTMKPIHKSGFLEKHNNTLSTNPRVVQDESFDTEDNIFMEEEEKMTTKYTSEEECIHSNTHIQPEENINSNKRIDPQFEFQIDFNTHVFESDIRTAVSKQPNRHSTHSDNKLPIVREIFQYFSNGTDHISIMDVLLLCRNCYLLRNWLTYSDVLKIIRRNTPMDHNISDHKRIDFNSFNNILVDIVRVKCRKDESYNIHSLFLHTVETDIAKSFKSAKTEDTTLKSILNLDVLRYFSTNSLRLQELFNIYAESGDVQGKRVAETTRTLSIAEFFAVMEAFELCPTLISRQVLSKVILPLCRQSPQIDNQGFSTTSRLAAPKDLNYPEFLEALARIAEYIFSDNCSCTLERLEKLFTTLGFSDLNLFRKRMKQAAIGKSASNSKRLNDNTGQRSKTPIKNTRPIEMVPVVDIRLYESLLRDERRLKEELHRIFMFYCSFGNRMNLDYLSSGKFKLFIKDIKITTSRIKQEELDLMFLKVLKSSNNHVKRTASSLSIDPKYRNSSNNNQRMDFESFMKTLQVLAQKLFSHLPTSTALMQLLILNILPFAQRTSDEFERVNMDDPQVQLILSRYRSNLQKIFNVYSNIDSFASKKHAASRMNCNEFFIFATEFGLVPKLGTKKDLIRIVRSVTTSSSSHDEISYEQFEECLIKYSVVAYSKHPYNIKYPTTHGKLQGILDRMDIKDITLIRKKFEKFGRHSSGLLNCGTNVPLGNTHSLARTNINSTASSRVSSPEEEDKINQNRRLHSLPSEEELDTALRDIFLYYAHYGEKSTSKHMTSSNFKRFVKESRLLGDTFSFVDAELTFVEITRNNQSLMIYDIFCDSLALIAHKKFPHLTIAEGLRDILLSFVLPFAKTKETVQNKEEYIPDPQILIYLKKYDSQLSRLYKKYSQMEQVVGSPSRDEQVRGIRDSITYATAMRFCKDFNICPELINMNQLSDLFEVCATTYADLTNQSCDLNRLVMNYECFLGFLALLADKAYELTCLEETVVDKAKAFINKMGLNNSHKVEMILHGKGAFARKSVPLLKLPTPRQHD